MRPGPASGYAARNAAARAAMGARVPDRRWGIVFCGGGGRGAYEIGVWKRLAELGLDREITGVSGASVGALNSLLLAQGDVRAAEELWLRIRQEDLTPRPDRKAGRRSLLSDGLFRQDRLEGILQTEIDHGAVTGARKLIYSSLTALEVEEGRGLRLTALYPCWAFRTWEEIREMVLASSAFPLAYGPRDFEGMRCLDGCVRDNRPVRPLLEDGFQNLLIVYLSEGWKHRAGLERLRRAHPETVFRPVWPEKGLGGMLRADPDLTAERIRRGYRDACRMIPENMI